MLEAQAALEPEVSEPETEVVEAAPAPAVQEEPQSAANPPVVIPVQIPTILPSTGGLAAASLAAVLAALAGLGLILRRLGRSH